MIFPSFLDSIHHSKTIASFLIDLGPDGLPNVDLARAILARFGLTESSPPTEQAIVDIIAGLVFVNCDTIEGETATNMITLVRAFTSFSRYVSWARIIRSLDEPEGFTIPHHIRWDALASLLLNAPSRRQHFGRDWAVGSLVTSKSPASHSPRSHLPRGRSFHLCHAPLVDESSPRMMSALLISLFVS